jgi:hypothetical protein|tara:strand:+ start:775 stop:1041 length:267 start_codon:yes stop_codon:yes gene_type:complete
MQARAQGYTNVQCDSVTFVQRFGSALNLNPHFHVLMLDGGYVCGEGGAAPVFVPPPHIRLTDETKAMLLSAGGDGASTACRPTLKDPL